MTQVTSAQVLTRAKEILEPEGRWMQKGYGLREPNGLPPIGMPGYTCLCLFGAINEALKEITGDIFLFAVESAEILDAMETQLLRITGEESYIEWNDDPSRTQAEVLAVLEKAIEVSSIEGDKS